MDKSKDIFGTAIKAYYNENDNTDISVHSPDFDDDIIPVDYLFRSLEEMPLIERTAIKSSSGKVLDVGCGAGSHALELQKNRDLEIHAIDTSEGAIEIAKMRGVSNAETKDFFQIKNEEYDTILLLMNGSGIIGKLENLDAFFTHCRTLLKENGQVLMDSSDLIYLFDDEDIPDDNYYGELQFRISYKGLESDEFDWLYIDPERLKISAEQNGFQFEIIEKGENHDYLAKLTLQS
ncbi:class I SAM-dependent methyltransferase [Christiangramia sp. SM2212]|uniref:Class I SAM-dependent methyltransferase n=1 Tax=Christiangramia sediminicola TaxID=3073267 RepID=A0ABU1ES03_9FLAO|nr:class I SAM-dependent methyltransferase [Christiangramia sp. SM2212]MDR5590933.1 class I SAM-dependent methyltransferase [Christiangramia sp. SM2212]